MPENYSCIPPFPFMLVRMFGEGCARNSVGRTSASIKPLASIMDSAHGCRQYPWLAEGAARQQGRWN